MEHKGVCNNTAADATRTETSSSATVLTSRHDEISVQDRRDMKQAATNYDLQRMIGHGSFGAVFMAKNTDTDEIVAIKKVLQDRRFKNRELQIMKHLCKYPHPYIVSLHHHFVSKGSGSKSDDVYLNLVLEYVPETIYSITKHHNHLKEKVPLMTVKLYMFQLARALAHIHGQGICHRDIKPQNLLIDPVKQMLKLCDFGSAKALVAGEPNVAYICSRYYRAPELIIGASEYSTSIDVWSQGCVFVELLTGTPLFVGESGIDQINEVVRILGSPTEEDMVAMNREYSKDIKIPQKSKLPWSKVFNEHVSIPNDAVDLIEKLLVYKPSKRLQAIAICTHPLFDDVKENSSVLPKEMFQFTREELANASDAVRTSLTSILHNQVIR